MTNYKTTQLGKIEDLVNLENGKAFLHDALELTGCEISVNAVPKGFKVPFNHRHKQNEEVYIVLKGEGIITVDSEAVNVKEGSAVKIMPEASRTIENTSDRHIVINAQSDKYEQLGYFKAKIKSDVILTNVISTAGQKDNNVVTVKIEGDLLQ